MQFKYPAIFYFLVLLIIPIIIHLFQLQKFKKIPFSNVQFLKQITLETRKSSRIKKLVILATRLLCFLALLFTFSQPYTSNKTEEKINHTFIYLDNSMSINSNEFQENRLKLIAQKLIQNTSETKRYSLLTNDFLSSNISKQKLDKSLKEIDYSTKKTNLPAKVIQIESEIINDTKDLYEVILISDFQNINKNNNSLFTNVNTSFSLINIKNTSKNNISIDSLFISAKDLNENVISVVIKNQGDAKNNIPIALYESSKLINKRSFSIAANEIKILEFNINKVKKFNGILKISFNDIFLFDNKFYFTINQSKKTAVLVIGKSSNSFSRIFSENEINYTNSSLQNIQYSQILNQQLIILNQLKKIPSTLQNSLLLFVKNGGHLVIIPNKTIDMESYNSFFNSITSGAIVTSIKDSLKITKINVDHPIYNGVFSKRVSNFQYPSVTISYQHTLKGDNILSFENKKPFLQELENPYSKIYWFSSPLDVTTSNFTNSPLIVPTLYNIGLKSLELAKPYYVLHQENKIDVNKKIGKDQIVTISDSKSSFIPLQRLFSNKITLTTNEAPKSTGFYDLLLDKDTLETIAFNLSSQESALNFFEINSFEKENKNIKIYNSVGEFFNEINKKNKVQWLWKLFLTIAIVSLLLEILILKFFKT